MTNNPKCPIDGITPIAIHWDVREGHNCKSVYEFSIKQRVELKKKVMEKVRNLERFPCWQENHTFGCIDHQRWKKELEAIFE